ncbi:hypothetical protein BE04_14270 [Sorangium cellulosum]|uniref:Uncharacterized protein n=1 Tax=Sorangium cellulosum TaxID=56 RepID=A0A150PTH2_SORCE|nr:hypothetical protein BE04_14270 [Sorangium cellulosum]
MLVASGLLGGSVTACLPGDGGSSSSGSGGSSSDGSGGSDGCGCVADPIRWGYFGGFTPNAETSALSPCRFFSFERRAIRGDRLLMTCSQELEACEEGVSAGDVASALGHPDVVAALAAAPVLYGRDARPVDGSLFRIQVDGAVVDVGYECGEAPDCVPIPDGVAALADALRTLTQEQLARQTCGAVATP